MSAAVTYSNLRVVTSDRAAVEASNDTLLCTSFFSTGFAVGSVLTSFALAQISSVPGLAGTAICLAVFYSAIAIPTFRRVRHAGDLALLSGAFGAIIGTTLLSSTF